MQPYNRSPYPNPSYYHQKHNQFQQHQHFSQKIIQQKNHNQHNKPYLNKQSKKYADFKYNKLQIKRVEDRQCIDDVKKIHLIEHKQERRQQGGGMINKNSNKIQRIQSNNLINNLSSNSYNNSKISLRNHKKHVPPISNNIMNNNNNIINNQINSPSHQESTNKEINDNNSIINNHLTNNNNNNSLEFINQETVSQTMIDSKVSIQHSKQSITSNHHNHNQKSLTTDTYHYSNNKLNQYTPSTMNYFNSSVSNGMLNGGQNGMVKGISQNSKQNNQNNRNNQNKQNNQNNNLNDNTSFFYETNQKINNKDNRHHNNHHNNKPYHPNNHNDYYTNNDLQKYHHNHHYDKEQQISSASHIPQTGYIHNYHHHNNNNQRTGSSYLPNKTQLTQNPSNSRSSLTINHKNQELIKLDHVMVDNRKQIKKNHQKNHSNCDMSVLLSNDRENYSERDQYESHNHDNDNNETFFNTSSYYNTRRVPYQSDKYEDANRFQNQLNSNKSQKLDSIIEVSESNDRLFIRTNGFKINNNEGRSGSAFNNNRNEIRVFKPSSGLQLRDSNNKLNMNMNVNMKNTASNINGKNMIMSQSEGNFNRGNNQYKDNDQQSQYYDLIRSTHTPNQYRKHSETLKNNNMINHIKYIKNSPLINHEDNNKMDGNLERYFKLNRNNSTQNTHDKEDSAQLSQLSQDISVKNGEIDNKSLNNTFMSNKMSENLFNLTITPVQSPNPYQRHGPYNKIKIQTQSSQMSDIDYFNQLDQNNQSMRKTFAAKKNNQQNNNQIIFIENQHNQIKNNINFKNINNQQNVTFNLPTKQYQNNITQDQSKTNLNQKFVTTNSNSIQTNLKKNYKDPVMMNTQSKDYILRISSPIQKQKLSLPGYLNNGNSSPENDKTNTITIFSPSHRNSLPFQKNHYLNTETQNDVNNIKQKKSIKKMLVSQNKHSQKDIQNNYKHSNSTQSNQVIKPQILLNVNYDHLKNQSETSRPTSKTFMDVFTKNHLTKILCSTFKIGQNQNGCGCVPKCYIVDQWLQKIYSNHGRKHKSLIQKLDRNFYQDNLSQNQTFRNYKNNEPVTFHDIKSTQKKYKLTDDDTQTFKQIDKDIPRTYSDHPTFKSLKYQQFLREVLVNFYYLDKKLGYIQGMNLIGASFVYHSKTVYQAVQLMDFIVNMLDFRAIYENEMRKCKQLSYKTCKLIRHYCYDMYSHVTIQHQVQLQMFIMGWFLSLLGVFVPLQSMNLVISKFIDKQFNGIMEIIVTYFIFIKDILMAKQDQNQIMEELSVHNMMNRSKHIDWNQLITASDKLNVSAVKISL